MQKSQRNQTPDNSIARLPLTELRQKWAECWGMQPHASISRGILAQSLEFRLRELETGGLSAEQRARLEQLKKAYRRNPKYFDDACYRIKPGTRLVRTWHGTKYSVIVLESGFQYQDKTYGSLSEIASQITGTRWNGWVFFGLKKEAHMKPLNKYCAIYTRKSSEEGLEQDFNSLDAQRESCMAYIVSQKSEGWSAIKESYDDGGYTGGNMERPALKKLLEDIQAGKVHTVVVYKIDRLTRSLMDFSKLVEVFDGHGVTFVSVTQSFNTTTSMGRLTLNVLLSFAQFEREVTGERIRDKIAASKKKGMWMGGMIPIGYDRIDKKLVVNPEDTATVRMIFEKYLKLGCVRRLKEYLDASGYRSKIRITKKGEKWGGVKFSRGLLYKTLSDPIYIGNVRHKEKVYQGQHNGIIPQQLWDDVQKLLTGQSATKRGTVIVKPAGNLLKGLLFDKAGSPYSPVFTKKNGKEYRYYVSQNTIQLRDHPQDIIARLPAYELETIIKDAIQKEFSSPQKLGNLLQLDINEYGPKLKHIVEQNVQPELLVSTAVNCVVLDSDRMIIKIDTIKLCRTIADIYKVSLPHVMEMTIIEVPFQTGRSKHGTLLIEPDNKPASDKGPLDLPPNEMKNLVEGLIWRDEHFAGMTLRQIAAREQITPRYISLLIERTFALA